MSAADRLFPAATRTLYAEWSGGEPHRRSDIRRVERLLRRTLSALGVGDEHRAAILAPKSAFYQLFVVRRALDNEAAREVGALLDGGATAATSSYRSSVEPGWVLKTRSGASGVTGFGRGTAQLRLDVNGVQEPELADLPGFGATSARRLVAHRFANGNFDSLDAARRGARLAPSAFDRAASFLFVGDGRAPVLALDPNGLDPFEALVTAVHTGQVTLAGLGENASRGECVVALLERLVVAIERDRPYPRHWAPSRARLERGQRSLRRLDEVRRRGTSNDAGVAVITGSAYVDAIEGLIGAATERVDVAVFYFAVPSDESPAARLMRAVIAAHQRGVAVRVILDDDLATDYHGANAVNADAAARLTDAGVPLRRTAIDRTLHAKTVRVDDAVVVGSHNWTTSSFYRYDDTSMLVRGPTTARFTERFDRLWASYHPNVSDRVHSVRDLEWFGGLERDRLRASGISTARELVAAGARVADRRDLAAALRSSEEHVGVGVSTARLMVGLGVGEATAVALVQAGLDTPAQVESASLDSISAALDAMATMSEPFARRLPPPGLAEWVWRLER